MIVSKEYKIELESSGTFFFLILEQSFLFV